MANAKAGRACSLSAGLMPVLATGIMIFVLPAHAAGAIGSDRLPTLIDVSPLAGAIAGGTAQRDEAPIRLAAKISKAVKGAAVGSRAARSRSNESKDEQGKSEDEPSADGASDDAGGTTEDNTATGGPFKMNVPSQGEAAAANSPPGNQPSAAAEPDKSGSPGAPVRTLIDRSATDAARAASAPAGAAAAAADNSSPCIAGCYTPTSAQVKAAPVRKAGGQTQSAGNAASPPIGGGIECVAGCDGIIGSTIPRATTGVVERSDTSARAPEKGTSNRVMILRGSTRTKQYGVN